MHNYIINFMKFTAALLSLISKGTGYLSWLYNNAVPVYESFTELAKTEKYAHLKVRVEKIRDLAMQLVLEVIQLGKAAEKAVKDNPDDFKFLAALEAQREVHQAALKEEFNLLGGMIAELDLSEKAAKVATNTWLRQSPVFEDLETAVKGPKVNIQVEQFWGILGIEYYTDYAPKPEEAHGINAWRAKGGSDSEFSSWLASEAADFQLSGIGRMKRHVAEEGNPYMYSFGGTRYVIHVPEDILNSSIEDTVMFCKKHAEVVQ